MVRALGSHLCGPVQIPVLMPYVGWVCCWFYPFAPRGVSLGTPVFPSPYKPALPNSNSIWNAQFTCFNKFLRTRKSSVGKQIIFTITRLHSLGSYFKTFSVGLAEVWTHEVLLSSLVLIQFIIHVRKMYNSQTNEFYLAHLKTPFHCKCQVQVKADFIYCCHCRRRGGKWNVGLRKFWQDLEISEAFLISLEVSFLHGLFLLFLSLETFYQRVSGLDF